VHELNRDVLPKHIAIIMDGNGRWAEQRSLTRIAGHQKGIKRAKEVIRSCRKLGIQVLTLYAFSTENWNRPQKEIKTLMRLLKRFLTAEGNQLIRNNIRLNTIGAIEELPQEVNEVLSEIMDKTKDNSGMVLNAALSYSGRSEIIHAIRTIAKDVRKGTVKPHQIDETLFSSYLYTTGLPDPDLLIRTSGELRISNFLLWQLAYTELYITNTLWPDFTEKDLLLALQNYQKRERRFGLTQQQIKRKLVTKTET
jgi:undecaprenyl diphosphate synthase